MDGHGIFLVTYHLIIYQILWDGTGHALGRKQRGNKGKQGMNYIPPSALGDGQKPTPSAVTSTGHNCRIQRTGFFFMVVTSEALPEIQNCYSKSQPTALI
jgi:hypothetical protein